MGKGFFDELRDKLYGEKAELERTLASIDKELSRQLKDSIGELSSYDQHAADLGQETFERGKDIALRENTRRLLDDTNRAIEAMDVGAYGICQTCGRPIDDQRLRAIPWTTQCFESARIQGECRRQKVSPCGGVSSSLRSDGSRYGRIRC